MDASEIKEAGNALIQWANSQEIGPGGLMEVMAAVAAKAIITKMGKNPTRDGLAQAIDKFGLQVVNEVNLQLYGRQWGDPL